jgi:hypothetical protein
MLNKNLKDPTSLDILINDFSCYIKDLRDCYARFSLINIYLDHEQIDLMLTEFIGQYDLLLTEQQKDYIRLL